MSKPPVKYQDLTWTHVEILVVFDFDPGPSAPKTTTEEDANFSSFHHFADVTHDQALDQFHLELISGKLDRTGDNPDPSDIT